MSHNKIKVNSENPDSNGNIPIKISSYITESNPQNSQLIKYDGGQFINSFVSVNSALNLKLGLHYSSTGWSGGSYDYSVGDYYSIRDYGTVDYQDTGFDYNNATGANTPQTNNKWLESIDIPTAGKYLFIVSICCNNGTSMTVKCSNNAGEFGVKCISKKAGYQSPFVFGISDCVANDIFKIVVKSKSGSPQIMDDEEARLTSILIFKLE